MIQKKSLKEAIKNPEIISVVGGLLPEVTVEKKGLMSKNDKFYMPKFSNEEKVHVGKMTSKFSDSNRCDVILGITITSNGNGVSYALIAIYIKSNNEFEYKVLYNNGNIHRDIIKCKVSNKTVDIYSIRSGIKLLVQVLSVGSSTSFDLDMLKVDQLPDELTDLTIE